MPYVSFWKPVQRVFVVKVGSGTGLRQDSSEMDFLSGAVAFLIAKGNSTTDEVRRWFVFGVGGKGFITWHITTQQGPDIPIDLCHTHRSSSSSSSSFFRHDTVSLCMCVCEFRLLYFGGTGAHIFRRFGSKMGANKKKCHCKIVVSR